MKDWQRKAIELEGTGLSWRKIAKKLNKPKSTVSDFLRSFKNKSKEKSVFNSFSADGPKILIFDLETAPELSYHFGRYKTNIPTKFNVRPSYILSFSAKWYGEPSILTKGLIHYDEWKHSPYTDFEICKELKSIVDKADIIVAHNLKRFDFLVLQTRLLLNRLGIIDTTKFVDTLEIARREFKFPKNTLEELAVQLGVKQKLSNSGAEMWVNCIEGNMESWHEMLEYNTVDVEVLEEIYELLRPYSRKHPNVAMYYNDTERRCVCCGSTELESLGKSAYTQISQFEVYKCLNCGKNNRTRTNSLTKEKRKSLLTNIQY